MAKGSPNRDKRPGKRNVGLIAAAVALVVAVAAGGAVLVLKPRPGDPGEAVNTDSAARRGKPMTFTQIFEQVSPAVVSINVTVEVDPRAARPFGFGLDDEPVEGQAPEDEGEGGPSVARSSGSGFFVAPEGLVLTNNHVIQGDGEITVALKDGRELKASIVGRDETTDLALLRVSDPKEPNAKFPFVSFEDSARPRVGDWIIAIGNPFGLGGTATAGIVSAYGRDIGEGVDFLQIDAPINRGNSGGPSFDVYGRVIGVNTAIFSPTGGSVGIGFAVPADLAAGVTRQLATGKSILRGYIGASVVTLTPAMAQSAGLPVEKGAMIADVTQGGPADRGGLRRGDVVTAVDGQAVEKSGEMTRAVGKVKPGQLVRLAILRDGKRRTVIVRTGTRPTERELASRR